jgi:DNA replication protein DnaC
MSVCERCGGAGLFRTERGTSAVCGCQAAAQAAARIRRAHIPPAFEAATLENFEATAGTRAALLLAQGYAPEFPAMKTGLLFTGTVGTGKTHLAVGIARCIAGRGFNCRFVDVGSLLEKLRHSYDPGTQETQHGIMAPIYAADLVVIDELGAQRATDWCFETLELLIGGLYNRMVFTIVTTNLPNLPAGGGETNGYERAARAETLGDRIGPRMFSRLQQMCRPVPVTGPDWRARR